LKLKKADKIGIGVGVSVGSLLLSAIAAYCWRSRKKPKDQTAQAQPVVEQSAVTSQPSSEPKLDYTQPLNLKS